ncbi:hypothetical protein G6F56_005377 [Rhizopus delemar]|nr:hypothetical protein G6F56_005377 [Rhizopus delemar]
MYQLSVERSTPLHKQYLKGLIPEIPDDDLSAEMYEETIRLSKEYGFNHYEVSSYAKGQQAISRHNFSYWQGMDYLGIGPGAHGRLTDHVSQQRVRTFGEFHPDKYMALCEKEGEGIRKIEPIQFQDMAEFVDKEQLKMLIENGFLIEEKGIVDNNINSFVPKELLNQWKDGGGIRPTEMGLERIDYILPRLLVQSN